MQLHICIATGREDAASTAYLHEGLAQRLRTDS
jgi:hypothetical protein